MVLPDTRFGTGNVLAGQTCTRRGTKEWPQRSISPDGTGTDDGGMAQDGVYRSLAVSTVFLRVG